MSKTTPSRYPSRSTEDKERINKIIDEGIFCTVAFIRDGIPHQIPTGFFRVEDELYIHASSKSKFMESIVGQTVSFSVTHADALVLAPTAFDHSFNYRSVIGFSRAEEITDAQEKKKLFNQFTDRYIPGRIEDIGEPSDEQVSITKIVKLSLDQSAAKVRDGDVGVKLKDDAPWCGIIPVESNYGNPVKDEQLPEELETPSYIKDLLNGSGTT